MKKNISYVVYYSKFLAGFVRKNITLDFRGLTPGDGPQWGEAEPQYGGPQYGGHEGLGPTGMGTRWSVPRHQGVEPKRWTPNGLAPGGVGILKGVGLRGVRPTQR